MYNLHNTVDDAARNKMMIIIMHPKPPHLPFILDIESMIHEYVSLQGELIDGRTHMSCINWATLYTHVRYIVVCMRKLACIQS